MGRLCLCFFRTFTVGGRGGKLIWTGSSAGANQEGVMAHQTRAPPRCICGHSYQLYSSLLLLLLLLLYSPFLPIAMSASLVSRLHALSPALRLHSAHESGDEAASIISSQGTCSSLEASTSSSSSYTRPNEHLAVLLPRHLWKPDAQAARCDTFMCRKKFTMWERKHHCRKCGGVFCGECSSRATTLLDASKLDFLHPPKHVPIVTFHSPTSPVRSVRVCDECWDQIHGCKSNHSPVLERSVPLAFTRQSYSAASSLSGSPITPPDALPALPVLPPRPSMRRAHTSPRIPQHTGSPLRTSSPLPPNVVSISGAHITESDLGELETYPLRHASAICKATGGGRWEPKPVVRIIGQRVPGYKAPYELDLEREEEEQRIRRANPILRDGDFQLRVPRELEPCSPGGPNTLSTF
ncbi:FYVE zinc finger-domain-containing protein [Cristinia sonorae]|uniref:FYVE zinc finger-domain-containing protein n=1 Tax=Cristinia sonorae TaxID=1940300 RepID=A0A8K0UPK6_9AGAR|nr:FYVE zinc finger-domain-containing protein [Cristinia sonorae]